MDEVCFAEFEKRSCTMIKLDAESEYLFIQPSLKRDCAIKQLYPTIWRTEDDIIRKKECNLLWRQMKAKSILRQSTLICNPGTTRKRCGTQVALNVMRDPTFRLCFRQKNLWMYYVKQNV